jgi:hypothetical protein
MWSVLPLATEFYVTSRSILSHSSSFGTSLPVCRIIIYDTNGSVDMLKKIQSVALVKGVQHQKIYHLHRSILSPATEYFHY